MERSDGDCLSWYPASGFEITYTRLRGAIQDKDDSHFQVDDHDEMMELGAACELNEVATTQDWSHCPSYTELQV